MIGDGDEVRFDWRRGGAAAAGLIAALVLLAMVWLVAAANAAREQALSAERHTYEVALVVRNVSSSVSRAEAALARYVLDEDEDTSGTDYASNWQLAAFQIRQLEKLVRGNAEQEQRVATVMQLYQKRGQELALAATAARQNHGQAGSSYYYGSSHEEKGKPPSSGTKLV